MDEPVDITPKPGPILLLRLKRKILARHPLEKPIVTMGRGSKCDIVLDDSSGVSRLHAQVLVAEGEVMLEDMGSRNGTFVNSKLVQKRTLRPGDRIAIGDYRLHFLQAPRQPAEEPQKGNAITELMRRWRGAAINVDRNECPLCGDTGRHATLEESPDSETGEHPHTIEGRPGGFTGLNQNMLADEHPTTDTSLNIDTDEALAAEPGDELDVEAFTVAADDPLAEEPEIEAVIEDSERAGPKPASPIGVGVEGVEDEVAQLKQGVAEISAQLETLAAADDELAAEDRAAEESAIEVFPPPSIVDAYSQPDDQYDEIMKKVSALVDQKQPRDVSAETSPAPDAADESPSHASKRPSLRSKLRRKNSPRRKLRLKR